MDFGEALKQLKESRRVRRTGWNGKNMYVAYMPGYPYGVPINNNTAEATDLPLGTICKFLPYLLFRTAQGEFVPWLASQTDLLAEDWELVPSS